MSDHREEDLRVQRVAEKCDDTSGRKEQDIQGEDRDGDPVEPLAVVGQGVQEDGHYSSAHGDGEPAGSRSAVASHRSHSDQAIIRGSEMTDNPPPTHIMFGGFDGCRIALAGHNYWQLKGESRQLAERHPRLDIHQAEWVVPE